MSQKQHIRNGCIYGYRKQETQKTKVDEVGYLFTIFFKSELSLDTVEEK